MSRIKASILKDIYLVILAALLGLLALYLIAPFLTALLLALIIVAMFQPMYKALLKRMRPGLASTLCTIIVLLIVIIPLIIMVIAISGEIVNFSLKAPQLVSKLLFNSNGEIVIINQINALIAQLNPTFQLSPADLQNTIFSILSSITGFFSNILLGIFQNLASLFLQFIVFIFALSFMFRDFDKIPNFITRYIPLSDDLELFLYDEFIKTGKSVIKGSFLVAFIHTVALILVYSLFGIQGLSLIALLIFVVSFIPGGSQFIWLPTLLILGFSSGWLIAIGFGIACFIVTNSIDSFIRPKLTNSGTKIHPLLSLLSILGGLAVFGPMGLLYGPLIIVLFMTVLAAYNQRFREVKDDADTEVQY